MPKPSRLGSSTSGWSRLKPAPRDDLTVYGFPSKGETRLNDFKAQENYFNVIFERYMRFCNDSRDCLADEFAKLGFAESGISVAVGGQQQAPSTAQRSLSSSSSSASSTRTTSQNTTQQSTVQSTAAGTSKEPSQELTKIHLSMRKLRESILSTHRTDPFAQSTYLFIIRATLLTHSYASYQPAILHLLSKIAPVTPLSASDARAVSIWRILDAACRLGDLAGALRLRTVVGLKDGDVDLVLRAFVHGEWGCWWFAKGRVDGYSRALMDMGEDRIRKASLKVLAGSYLSVGKGFVESVAGRQWEDLVRDGVGWELKDEGEREVVVIRRVRR